MKRCLVLGKTNAGKSLFAVAFAQFTGVRRLRLRCEPPGRAPYEKQLTVQEALRELVGPVPHQTRGLHGLTIDLPAGKGKKRIELVDTSGLMEGIPGDERVRRAMAQTLAAVRNADLILHVVDASKATRRGALEAVGEVDFQVAQFGQMRSGYAILANKMDLPGSEEGLAVIRSEFTGHTVFPISALKRTGFQEVRRFVGRWL